MYNFPSSPAVGDAYPSPPVAGKPLYKWDGEKWTTWGGGSTPSIVTTWNGRTGDVIQTLDDIVAAGGAPDGSYLPLTGGIVTGPLTVEGALVSTGNIVIDRGDGVANLFSGKKGGKNNWLMQMGDGSAAADWYLGCYADDGITGSTPLWISRATLKATFGGALSCGTLTCGTINGLSSIQATNTIVIKPSSASAIPTLALMDTNGAWNVQLTYTMSSGAVTLGNLGGYILIDGGGAVITNKSISAGTTLNCTQACVINDTGSMCMSVLCSGGQWYGQFSYGNGRVSVSNAYTGSTIYLENNSAFYSTTPYCNNPNGGPWGLSSDSRIKTVLGGYKAGLKELLKLNVVNYVFKGNDTSSAEFSTPNPQDVAEGKELPEPYSGPAPYPASLHYGLARERKPLVGLVAQELEKVFPDTVVKRRGFIDGQEVDDLRDMYAGELTFALINAVKELSARVVSLEARLKAA